MSRNYPADSASAPRGGGQRWLVWLLAGLVAVGVLVWAGWPGGTSTPEERATAISKEVRCPTCKGLSAYDSNSPAAVAVRVFVEEGVRAGKSDAQIKGELTDRYGASILLRPERSGLSGMVWALPVVVMIIGAAFVWVILARARNRSLAEATDGDRRTVAAARKAEISRRQNGPAKAESRRSRG